jgi:hypothetical protein
VLVLVLGVTAFVGVIGLSSLLAVRLEHRDAQARADAAQAQQFADGALQLIHARLSADDGWRSRHTHDAWTADEALAPAATLRYRLTDLTDADLADDAHDPARLTVRVAHGRAVRLASIEFAGGLSLGPELLTNPGLETGAASPWAARVAGRVELDPVEGSEAAVGNVHLQLKNRDAPTDGPVQSIDGRVEDGQTYYLGAWVRMNDATETATLGLETDQGLLLIREDTVTAPVGTDWTWVDGVVTHSFSGLLSTYHHWKVQTQTSSQDFSVDGMTLREVASTAVPVVRGSYRRELDD